jgi:hypothetical protein
MKSRIARTLSVLAVVALLVAFVAVAMPVQTASAHHVHLKALRQKDTQTTPVTITGATPGLIIASFQGVGMATNGMPGGLFEGATTAPVDGKDMQVLVPVGQETSIYGFDNEGYWLLGTVNPATSDDKTTLDAAKVIKATP